MIFGSGEESSEAVGRFGMLDGIRGRGGSSNTVHGFCQASADGIPRDPSRGGTRMGNITSRGTCRGTHGRVRGTTRRWVVVKMVHGTVLGIVRQKLGTGSMTEGRTPMVGNGFGLIHDISSIVPVPIGRLPATEVVVLRCRSIITTSSITRLRKFIFRQFCRRSPCKRLHGRRHPSVLQA